MTPGARTWWLISVAVLVGCAAAGSAEESQTDAAVNVHHDAHVTPLDSPKQIDASFGDGAIPIDASVVMPDSGGEPLICTDNSQCTNAGDCCFTLGGPGFCVPGTIFLGACIPN
jgi:hypothetical protein